jgi:hypothetical protein
MACAYRVSVLSYLVYIQTEQTFSIQYLYYVMIERLPIQMKSLAVNIKYCQFT